MSYEKETSVTSAELEALIQGWGASPEKSIDQFYPLRFWYIFFLALFYSIWLLFANDSAVQRMTTDATDSVRMGRFLYFRGWFILCIIVLGSYAYFKNWYPAIVMSALFLMACVNLVFDLFNVYAAALSQPTPQLTLMILARIIAITFLYLCVKNSSRLPNLGDRANLLLIFKRTQ
ncbi:hypothetical protein [Haliscomenobacter sp.]|uniref:hypothetical protein n=1 Tax=Haliscomenobacter sp. TaxID=2717303 RepID=UPI003364DEB0